MTRKQDLQQFFICANDSQDRRDFDLDKFTEDYIKQSPETMIQTLKALAKQTIKTNIVLDKNSYNRLKAEMLENHELTLSVYNLTKIRIDKKMYKIEVKNFYNDEIFIKFE